MKNVLKDFNCLTEKLSLQATQWTGTAWAFALACLSIIIWALTGPIFAFCDTWQLVINTSTTIVTFLMVFLIQRTQNKDSLVIQTKLNEVLAALEGASNRLINIEDLTEEEVRKLHDKYKELLEISKKEIQIDLKHSVDEIGKEESQGRKDGLGM